ncbi:GH25 family lysozyme [Streptomyces sp. ISID311]|uniref:GH25 family lysozyme n=1 Tax=Streptomyces sp. ISID311 TaxID=2601673 RepID=UPI0011BD3D29|nr:GH25 family lysozyme [Streptomyces sp. ISID311]TXC89937.1 hypothetical protein FS847_35030 [Streptomyces sp. ISID311]
MHTIIDISKWQGQVDFDRLKFNVAAGEILSVIVRVGLGGSGRTVDHRAHRNLTEAKRVGLPVGLYWYAPEPLASFKQIDNIVEKLEDFARLYKPEYPLFLDVEGEQNWQSLERPLNYFITQMTNRGMYPGLYGSEQVLYKRVNMENIAPNLNWARWVAKYSSKEPACDWDIWQYTSKGKIPGISGNVDKNRCQKDYKKIIKERKLNFWTS